MILLWEQVELKKKNTNTGFIIDRLPSASTALICTLCSGPVWYITLLLYSLLVGP
jgi:hypothetical protein